MRLEEKSVRYRWMRGKIDKTQHHLEISYGDPRAADSSGRLDVAVVSMPENMCFTVEFLVSETDPTVKKAIDATIKELDFYLVNKGEKDPWAYGLYHCTTAANVYSSVWWSASPGVILDWNHREIQICRSRGGVIATTHPFDNLVRPSRIDWPPVEIVQKLYKSRHEGAFKDLDRQGAIYGLGYYCDLQSLHSEDAITWSVFGTLRSSPKKQREMWLSDFFGILGLPDAVPDNSEISLWRRTPHPDNLSPGGPEIDFWITTRNAVILGEAKWLSGVGASQGKAKDKDQLQIRQKLLQEHGHKFFPGKAIQAIVGISLLSNALKNTTESDVFHSTTWGQICKLDSHPDADEVLRYLLWKESHI